jgi:hypothetical protein
MRMWSMYTYMYTLAAEKVEMRDSPKRRIHRHRLLGELFRRAVL